VQGKFLQHYRFSRFSRFQKVGPDLNADLNLAIWLKVSEAMKEAQTNAAIVLTQEARLQH